MNKIDAKFLIFLIFRFVFLGRKGRGTKSPKIMAQSHTPLYLLIKVSKSRKQISKFSFEPKIKQKYFCISAALSTKKRSNKKNKGTLYH